MEQTFTTFEMFSKKLSLDIPEGFDPCPGILADPKFHGRIMLSSKKEL
jgi:hypothetical protein